MSRDKVILLEPPSDEETKAIMIKEDGSQQEGVVGMFKEGKPIHGDEIIMLSPTFHPRIYNVEERISISGKGPVKVATREYRENYDKIFGAESLPN